MCHPSWLQYRFGSYFLQAQYPCVNTPSLLLALSNKRVSFSVQYACYAIGLRLLKPSEGLWCFDGKNTAVVFCSFLLLYRLVSFYFPKLQQWITTTTMASLASNVLALPVEHPLNLKARLLSCRQKYYFACWNIRADHQMCIAFMKDVVNSLVGASSTHSGWMPPQVQEING